MDVASAVLLGAAKFPFFQRVCTKTNCAAAIISDFDEALFRKPLDLFGTMRAKVVGIDVYEIDGENIYMCAFICVQKC
jgi:hypothetical protein